MRRSSRGRLLPTAVSVTHRLFIAAATAATVEIQPDPVGYDLIPLVDRHRGQLLEAAGLLVLGAVAAVP